MERFGCLKEATSKIHIGIPALSNRDRGSQTTISTRKIIAELNLVKKKKIYIYIYIYINPWKKNGGRSDFWIKNSYKRISKYNICKNKFGVSHSHDCAMWYRDQKSRSRDC